MLFMNEESIIQMRESVDEQEDDLAFTEEEIKLMELRKRQELHRKELELLTSDNCPKKHPFDFGPRDLAEIKRIFPHGP